MFPGHRADADYSLETATAVADLSFPDGIDEAVIADSTTYAGALSGSGLAGALNAPVLLTPPDQLAATTRDALIDLGVTRVTIAGGEAEVSSVVAAELAAVPGIDSVTRFGGNDGIATAAVVAQAAASVTGDLPTIGGDPAVLMASGEDFPDALALSGPAHDGGFPLLLTAEDTLSPEPAEALDRLLPEVVLIAGGGDAVSDTVAMQIEDRGPRVIRVGGRNRVETSTVLADFFVEIGYLEARTPLLARGDAFPDALTAGSLSSIEDAPIILSANPDLLGEFGAAWFTDNCPTIEVLQVVGGTDAVSVALANGAEGAAESCGDPAPGLPVTGQTYAVQPMQAYEVEAPATVDFEIARRYDGEDLVGPLDLILFPCDAADVTGSGPDRFADTDGDGDADGFAQTNTGFARIAVVNGEDITDDTIVITEPDEDGDIDVRIASETADCTVLAVVAGNGNGALDLDADGSPVERYGVGKVTFTAAT